MTNIDEAFIGADTKLHLVATLGAAITTGADEVAEVAEIGEVNLTANITEFNAFGKSFKEKRVGQKDPGTLDMTLNWIPGDTKHKALKTAFDNKAKIFLSIVWHWGVENARADMAAYVASYGVETPLEDIVKVKIQLALTGPLTIDEDTDDDLNY